MQTLTRAEVRAFSAATRGVALSRAAAGGEVLLRALVSGALLTLSFPPFELYALAWVALVPVLDLTARLDRREVSVPGRALHPAYKALSCAWLAGAFFAYASSRWVTHSMIVNGGMRPVTAHAVWLIAVSFVAIFITVLPTLALLFVLTKLGTRRSEPAGKAGVGGLLLLAFPFFWTAGEYLRFQVFGLGWMSLGYSQAFRPELIAASRWGGHYAVGFLVVLMNCALTLLIVARDRAGRLRAAGLIALVLLVLGVARWEQARSTARGSGPRPAVTSVDSAAGVEREPGRGPTLLVAGIQPVIPTLREQIAARGEPVLTSEMFEEQVRLSRSALAQADVPGVDAAGTARLVVWPESPIKLSYGSSPLARGEIEKAARRLNAALLIPSLERAQAANTYYNSAVLVGTDGSRLGQYNKFHLVPFGEYRPLKFLGLERYTPALAGEFARDEEPSKPLLLHTAEGTWSIGVEVCSESAYPDITRLHALGGVDFLVVSLNDGYFGNTPILRQHLGLDVLRAVENARPLLRVANTGVTAAITPEGRVIHPTAPHEASFRLYAVEKGQGLTYTFYSEHGDLFAQLATAVAFMFIVTPFFYRRGPRGRGLKQGRGR